MKIPKKDREAVQNKTIVLSLDPVATQLVAEEKRRLETFEKAEKGDETAKRELSRNSDPLTLIADALAKHGSGDNIGRDKPVKMAFDVDPSTATGVYDSLYKAKLQLLPDSLIKKVCRQDDLIAAVLNARSNQVSSFGRPRANRFDIGYDIVPLPGILEEMEEEESEESGKEGQKEALQKEINEAKLNLFRCGRTEGWKDSERLNFPEFLKMITYDGLRFGRFAVEPVTVMTDEGKREFHSVRNVDAGTIYRVSERSATQAESVRSHAIKILQEIKNEKLDPEKFFPPKDNKDAPRYDFVQVIDGRPVQAFTHEELFVHNLYPATDVEYNGYPLTPLDTIINAVTTHINISLHNKLYFQSGRATRGMLVVKADGIDQAALQQIRLQFNASINSVTNAWRMPVFGMGPEDDISWVSVESSVQRDAEFQFLADSNARTILSAFQMSPEELPGYAHLSRGTNSQALSEGNNEYKLEAARDVGIRPLLMSIQDFVNDRILPLIAPKLKGRACFAMVGLDADDPEKESARLAQDSSLHMTYNEVLQRVEKDPIEPEFGGNFPLSPQMQTVIDKYLPVDEILERFFDRKDAKGKPELAYVRDPFWFQWQQLLLQREQMAAEATAMAQGQALGNGGELTEKANELAEAAGLTKSEAQLSPDRKRMVAMHNAIVRTAMTAWEQESAKAMADILAVAGKHKGRGK